MALSEQEKLDLAVSWLSDADGLLITAGAGMGVDSGLPAFRGRRGLWRAYPALKHLRLRFAEVSTEMMLHTAPALSWGFHGHLLQLFRAAIPHDGFHILARWSQAMEHGAFVFTSNIDGHFQRAGFAEDRIVECHGSFQYLQCVDACGDGVWSADSFHPEVDLQTCRLVNHLPCCSTCGRMARPNALLFNDFHWAEARVMAQRENLARWLGAVTRPVVIELGAGKAISTVRQFSERMDRRIIRVNPHDYRIANYKGVGFAGGALEVLKKLEDRLNEG